MPLNVIMYEAISQIILSLLACWSYGELACSIEMGIQLMLSFHTRLTPSDHIKRCLLCLHSIRIKRLLITLKGFTSSFYEQGKSLDF